MMYSKFIDVMVLFLLLDVCSLLFKVFNGERSNGYYYFYSIRIL